MRRFRLHALALAALALILLVAGSRPAAAQPVPNTCCTYTLIASAAIPAACFPIAVTTSWGGAVQTDNAPGPGSRTVYPIGGICPPPAPTFDWASLDGGVTTFPFGISPPIILPGCGFCVRLNSSRDAAGCLVIRVTVC